LQEVNRNLAADTKIAVVSELLDVLDDLERGARLDAPGTGSSGETLATLAKKFESRQDHERLRKHVGPASLQNQNFWALNMLRELFLLCRLRRVDSFVSVRSPQHVAIYLFLDSTEPKAEVHDS